MHVGYIMLSGHGPCLVFGPTGPVMRRPSANGALPLW